MQMNLKEALLNLNENSIKYLYVNYKKPIFLFVLGITNNYDLSEDITEETFFRIIKYNKSYNEIKNPKTWIFTIAKNTAYTYLKKNNDILFEDEKLEYILNKHNSVKNNDALVIEEYLSSLTKVERDIVILHVFGGLNHKDISKVLDLNHSQVRAKYTYALKKLKGRIGKNE